MKNQSIAIVLLTSLATAASAWADFGDVNQVAIFDIPGPTRHHHLGAPYQQTPDYWTDSSPYFSTSALVRPGFSTGTLSANAPTYAGRGTNHYISNTSRTSWFDTLTIDNPAFTGQTGALTIDVRFDGDISWAGDAQNCYMEDIYYLNGAATNLVDYTVGHNGVDGYTTSPWSLHQTFHLTTNFVYGQPIGLQEDRYFGVGQSRNTGNAQFASYDGTETTQWLGVTLVSAPDTSPDTTYTTTSSSGTDFTGAVAPEPTSLTLLLCGLAPFALRRRVANARV